MGVGAYVPKRQQQGDEMGNILQVGGAVAGGVFGGPAGIAMGSQLGGMAGGLMAEKPVEGPDPVRAGGSDALQRRMQKIQESPQMQIAQSIDSLKYIQDPQQRAELAKPLLQADYMARNKQA